jgi:hypothetical protein
MDKIPISFELQGKQYVGTLDEISGAGGGVWHLMVERYYWGRLRLVNDEWYLDESSSEIQLRLDYFVAVIIAWYQ